MQKSDKSKKKWFGKQKHLGSEPTSSETVTVPPLSQREEVNLTNVENELTSVENEQSEHANSVAIATAAAAEAAVVAAHAAAKAVRLSTVTQFAGKSKEEVAAIKIQTAFRRYLVCIHCFLFLFFVFLMKLFGSIQAKSLKAPI